MSNKTVKEHIQDLEDRIEKKLNVDLPTIVWIFIAVISADIIFNVATNIIAGAF